MYTDTFATRFLISGAEAERVLEKARLQLAGLTGSGTQKPGGNTGSGAAW